MTASSSQIAIWRFSTAPERLRSLCNGGGASAWLALVPQSLRGTAVERFLQRRLRDAAPLRFETAAKEVVYSGGAPLVARRKTAGHTIAAKSVNGRKRSAPADAVPR